MKKILGCTLGIALATIGDLAGRRCGFWRRSGRSLPAVGVGSNGKIEQKVG